MKEVIDMTRYFADMESAYEFIDRCGWQYDDYTVTRESDGAIKVVLS